MITIVISTIAKLYAMAFIWGVICYHHCEWGASLIHLVKTHFMFLFHYQYYCPTSKSIFFFNHLSSVQHILCSEKWNHLLYMTPCKRLRETLFITFHSSHNVSPCCLVNFIPLIVIFYGWYFYKSILEISPFVFTLNNKFDPSPSKIHKSSFMLRVCHIVSPFTN